MTNKFKEVYAYMFASQMEMIEDTKRMEECLEFFERVPDNNVMAFLIKYGYKK